MLSISWLPNFERCIGFPPSYRTMWRLSSPRLKPVFISWIGVRILSLVPFSLEIIYKWCFHLGSKPKEVKMRPMQDKDKRKLIEQKLKKFGKTLTASNIVLSTLTSLTALLLIYIIGPLVCTPMQFKPFVSRNSTGRIVHYWISPCPWEPTHFFLSLQWLAIFVYHCDRTLGGVIVFACFIWLY